MEKKQFRQTKTRSPPPRTSTFCIPRFRRKSTRLSPAMSLLDRFREAVFRLIMLSAISKAAAAAAANTDHHHHHQESRSSVNSPANCHRSTYNYYYQYSNDPHHSEAVADCIEFIKRSANDRGNRDSIDSTLPVMSCCSSPCSF